jgi:hypothetical protein
MSSERSFPTPKELFGSPTSADLQKEKEQVRDNAYEEVREFVEDARLNPDRLRVVSDYASLLEAQTTLDKAHAHLPVSQEDIHEARHTKAVVSQMIRTREDDSPSYLTTMRTFRETFEDKLMQAEIATLPVVNSVSRLDAKTAVAQNLLKIRSDYHNKRLSQRK